jgi:hypothetical protein
MPRHRYEYAVIRVVPRVDRGEFVNVGVIVHARTLGYLGVALELPRARLAALAPDADVEAVEHALALYPLVAAGDPSAGPVAALPQPDRFHWLTAPRSAMVQTSPVHSGLAESPAAALTWLIEKMVR